MNTFLDPLYIAARRVLIDAHDALGDHRKSLVLVGAQAVYLRAGDADLEAVAPFTSDADIAINPARLDSDPAIVQAMTAAGFELKVKAGGNGTEPGAWMIKTDVDGAATFIEVDLMVPQSVAPGKGRDAKLPHHGRNASRVAPGLEAAVIDNDEMIIKSLEPSRDSRAVVLRVAGVAALLVAKAHKLGERLTSGKDHRIKPKDAGDVFRLMRSPRSPEAIGQRLGELRRDDVCGASIEVGVTYLGQLFGAARSPGVDLAVDNLAGAVPEDELRVVMPGYLEALSTAYRS